MKKKESEKKPYHKEYGLFSNSRYVLGCIWEEDRAIFIHLAIAMIVGPILNYSWSFVSKFVIDTAMGKFSFSLQKFVAIAIAMGMVILLFQLLQTYVYSERWSRLIYIRIRQISKKNRKAMEMEYHYMEDTDLLDCFQKAGVACGGNQQGVEGLMQRILDFLVNLAGVATGIVILTTLNPLVVVLLVFLSVMSALFSNHTNKKSKKLVWDKLAPWWRKNSYIDETATDFSAAKDVRMFSLKQWILDKKTELNKERLAAQSLNEKIWFINSLLWNVLWIAGQTGVYAWLLYSVVKGGMSVGNFSLYLGSANVFTQGVNTITGSISDLVARSREVDDFRSFMDFEKLSPLGDRTDCESGKEKSDSDKKGIPVPKAEKYEFVFENVSFKYPRAEKFALKNLNITVKGGERLAVVGLNGAGKSTFIKLMLRLYKPTEGRILLNGIDVQDFDRASYFKVFAPLFQEVNLFAFSLAENISMQTFEKTDKALAEKCLKDAGLGKKLADLSAGVDTQVLKVIDDEGVDFSGGEKQKIALARALYKNSPVVVLDEPTAALDAIAESKLYQDFDQMIGNKTAVYISHRLSSTQFCNNVAMFKDGEMIEYGTHQSLLAAGKEYAEMWKVQAQYYVDSNSSEKAEA